MVTHEDIMEIQKVFDDRYVLQSDCNDRQETINKKFANDDKRIDRIILNQEHDSGKLTLNNWLTFAVLGCIIGAVIAYYVLGG